MKIATPRICFVTTELAPFTPGGIGVIIANFLRKSGVAAELHVLLVGGAAVNKGVFVELFPRATLHVAEQLSQAGPVECHYPPEWTYNNRQWQGLSVLAMRALKILEAKHGPYEVIEFPDYGGLAFATEQEKVLGLAFTESTIAVRLHSTLAALRRDEGAPSSYQHSITIDLERKSLRDADLVIAHLTPIANDIAALFGFAPDWGGRIKVQLPEVFVANVASETVRPSLDTSITFTSKLQRFKRPDVFLRGVTEFFRVVPEYRGRVLLLAHAQDEGYAESLRRLIPLDLKHRFIFQENLDNGTRYEIIAKSVAIFPSAYESFCLAAYEASLSGAYVILNGSNLAFGDGTPWKQGVNCLAFDGRVSTLAETLRGLFVTCSSGKALEIAPVGLRPDRPYWLTGQPKKGRVRIGGSPLLSVIIPHFNMGNYLPETLQSVLDSDYEKLEVVVVDDCSTDPLSIAVLDRIEHSPLCAKGPVRILRLPANRYLAAARNFGIEASSGRYIFPFDADDLVNPRLFSLAINALEANPEFDFVVPQVGFFTQRSQIDKEAFVDYAIHYGEAIRAGWFANRFSSAGAIGRVEAFRELKYDETMLAYEDWDFFMRACLENRRFIVTSDVHYYYRRREDSMFNGVAHDTHKRMVDRIRAKHRVNIGDLRVEMSLLTDLENYSLSQVDTRDPMFPLMEKYRLLFPKKGPGNRDIDYYWRENRPWWLVALRHPAAITRWQALRRVQRRTKSRE